MEEEDEGVSDTCCEVMGSVLSVVDEEVTEGVDVSAGLFVIHAGRVNPRPRPRPAIFSVLGKDKEVEKGD